ncbi:HAMP domain-containing protein [bacterium]|nr:HAMP domain-containing protein [bacterium]
MKYSKFQIKLMSLFLLTVLAPMLSLWFIVRHFASVESLQFFPAKAERIIQDAIQLDILTQTLINDPDLGDILQQHEKAELWNMLKEYKIEKNISDLRNLLRSYTIKSDVEKIIWLLMAVFVVVLMSIGIVSSVILSRGISNPIMKLVQGTQEVARGNLEHRVNVEAKDEIKLLVDSFNSMIDEVIESREKLKRTERIAAWRDAARKLAHEIKNPLTPIQLSMYRLKRNIGSERFPELFDECYNMITQEVDGLRRMVEAFSQFAKMPKPQPQRCDINSLIHDVLAAYQGIPETIQIKTAFAELPQIVVDEKQLRQVLHNLIQNSVDAMPEGGELSLQTQIEFDCLKITVQDSGHGMSEKTQRDMFTPYFTTKEKGTGLGLAIVQQIVQEHEGSIAVESQEGIGTKIVLSFPLRNE